MNNLKPTGCYVKATISVLKFPQVQGSLQLARKVALDQIAYESEARGLKSLKILGFSRCKKVQSVTKLSIILILEAVT